MVNLILSIVFFEGKPTGNHGFYHQIKGFPVKCPIIQFCECKHTISDHVSPYIPSLDSSKGAILVEHCHYLEGASLVGQT